MQKTAVFLCAVLFSACVSRPKAAENDTVKELPAQEFPLVLKLTFTGYDVKHTDVQIKDCFSFTQFLESDIGAQSDSTEMIVSGKMLRPGFITIDANDPALKKNWHAKIYADGRDTIFIEYDRQKVREGRLSGYPRVTSTSAVQQEVNRFEHLRDSLYDAYKNEGDSLKQILLKAIQTDNKPLIDKTAEIINAHPDKYRSVMIKTAQSYAASRPPSLVTFFALMECYIPRNDPAFGLSVYKNLPDSLRESPYGNMLNKELLKYAGVRPGAEKKK